MDILIVDDEPSIRKTTALAIRSMGHEADVAECLDEAREALRNDPFDVVLLDLKLGEEDGLELMLAIQACSKPPDVVVFTAHGTITSAVEAIQHGATDYVEKPFTPEHMKFVLSKIAKQRHLQGRVSELEEQVGPKKRPSLSSSKSPAMARIQDVVAKIRTADTGILILGESGTGKTVLARQIHEDSRRSSKPFVTVNCPSLTQELFASELFGHVKGAFTSAVKDHWGLVSGAEGGTLFFDEIGDLPQEIQPKLLRLLQEHEFERVGESTTRTADVRVIAATNRDLGKHVRDGTFREDLFYRLNVVTLVMPALRERSEDLRDLASGFLLRFAGEFGREARDFDKAAWKHIEGHDWPGNIRELQNFIEREVLMSEGRLIKLTNSARQANHANDSQRSEGIMLGDKLSVKEVELEHIKRVIENSETLSEAATVLGIDPTTLYRKRKEIEDKS